MIEVDRLIVEDICAPGNTVAKISRNLALLDWLDLVVVKQEPCVRALYNCDIMPMMRAAV